MRFQIAALVSLALLAGGCSVNAQPEASGIPSDDDTAAWNAAYEENASGKTDTAGCSGVTVPDRNGFNGKIALTFDDGPKMSTTPIVLETLARHNAKATFFVNGSKLTTSDQKQLLKKMAADGHFIGNHSQSHLNLKNVSSSTAESEVKLTQEMLTGLGINQRYFRFPFGSASCQSASIVRAHGYAVTGWHIDSADWCYASGKGGVGHCDASVFKYVDEQYRDDMVGYVLSQAKKLNGGVLLMHDIHAHTASMLDEVLTRLEEGGFEIVALNDTSAFPLLNGSKAAQSSWIGTPCTDDSGCKFSSGASTGSCLKGTASSGFCTLGCEGYCPDKPGAGASFCVSLDGKTGTCVSKSSADNQSCAGIAGTVAKQADRFVGSSSASASSATVCLPE